MEKSKEFYYHQLYELAATLNSTHAPETVLHSMVEGVAKAMGAKGCSLLLLEPDRRVLRHTVSHGLSERYTMKKGPVSADKSIAEALQGEAVVVLDATSDPRVQYPAENKKEGIASILSVPMMLRGETIGVMRVYTGEPYEFNPDDTYFVWAVANLGAIALENARLYQSLQKDYDTFRQEMLEWTAALGSEWMAEKSVVPSDE
jgi:GAF domain-containing protein